LSAEEEMESWNTFGDLEYYLVLKFEEYVAQCDSYTPAQKKVEEGKLKLMGMLSNLKSRNLPLAKEAYLSSAIHFRHLKLKSLDDYQPKHGKKVANVFPIKYIMELLGCSRRTAMDYQLVYKIQEQDSAVYNAKLAFISEPIAPQKETVTQHDTITTKEGS